MALEDLSWAGGADNPGGVGPEIYFADAEDLGTLPALATAGGLTVTAPVVLKALKKFFKVYTTDQKAKVDYNSVGSTDGMSKENILEFSYPGDDEAVANFEREWQNRKIVAIYRDGAGKFRIMGLANVDKAGTALVLKPAYLISSTGTTGAAAADEHGTTFQVRCNAAHRPLIYTGTIDTDSAT